MTDFTNYPATYYKRPDGRPVEHELRVTTAQATRLGELTAELSFESLPNNYIALYADVGVAYPDGTPIEAMVIAPPNQTAADAMDNLIIAIEKIKGQHQ